MQTVIKASVKIENVFVCLAFHTKKIVHLVDVSKTNITRSKKTLVSECEKNA